MKKLIIALIAPLFLGATASALTVTSANLPFPAGSAIPAGTTDLLQVTGALPGAVQGAGAGGPASADTRTFYFWRGDGMSTAPTFGLTFGNNWPVVFIPDGDTISAPGIAASVTAGVLQNTGLLDAMMNPIQARPLLVNDRPVYFFTHMFGDTSAATSNGIYGTWFGVDTNGAQIVPEPSTGLLLAGGLGVFGAIRRRSIR